MYGHIKKTNTREKAFYSRKFVVYLQSNKTTNDEKQTRTGDQQRTKGHRHTVYPDSDKELGRLAFYLHNPGRLLAFGPCSQDIQRHRQHSTEKLILYVRGSGHA